jgi:phosphoglycerate dehydrogenase-like enzyme
MFTLENLVITPHIGGADSRSLPNMAMLTARNIHAALNGKKIPSAANPEVFAKIVKPKL